jgi:transposase InsO family protein
VTLRNIIQVAMPWQESTLQEQRREVVRLALVPGANRSELCARFGISRKTLYKWLGVDAAGGELKDRSRQPHSSPRRSCSNLGERVVVWRSEHPTWGGRKIARRLLDEELHVSPSTVTAILRRKGLLDGPGAGKARAYTRFEREYPNELWQMDFKGHFPMLCGDRCHPFDCVDDRSRYCILLRACSNERELTVKSHLIAAFRTYGLPGSILCDNGGCWGAAGARDMTPLAVWLSLLGIQVLHGRPRHPQTQGKEERFHKTLDIDVLVRHGFADLPDCQRRFDKFREEYNGLRPHDSLKLETPASLYVCSPRTYPEGSPAPPEYLDSDIVRKVQGGGRIGFHGREFRVGKALKGQPVAIRPYQRDGQFEVVFFRSRVAIIDLTN